MRDYLDALLGHLDLLDCPTGLPHLDRFHGPLEGWHVLGSIRRGDFGAFGISPFFPSGSRALRPSVVECLRGSLCALVVLLILFGSRPSERGPSHGPDWL